ncbi:MAG: ABC transporter substrate-binding protein [Candidatus Sumerlaeaceae bacterium]|nr:ABC transporter substrate-binding protein [Candidatus Sumerlaeaceae bacterium]
MSQRQGLLRIYCAALLLMGVCMCYFAGCTDTARKSDNARRVLRIHLDVIGNGGRIAREFAAQYERETGIAVELISERLNSSERLTQYQQYLGARSADVDLYEIDVIWPAMLADYFVDVGPALGKEAAEFFPPIIRNNTIGGHLTAIPFHADAGFLYYRTDLLEKYGFEKPPQTWDELEGMAGKIQEGERAAGNANFTGYLWQGKAREGLTCNVLEWFASQGGGRIVETDGRVTINNPRALSALDRARKWVGGISPPNVTDLDEDETRKIFEQGNAAFMRNWSYAYSVMRAENSPVATKFKITQIPAGDSGHFSTLGGWQLAVSRYSRQPEEAIKLAKWLTAAPRQEIRAIQGSFLPSRPAVYETSATAAAIPQIAEMKEILVNTVPRPSGPTTERYSEVSTLIFTRINKVLRGELEPGPALEALDSEIKRTLQ